MSGPVEIKQPEVVDPEAAAYHKRADHPAKPPEPAPAPAATDLVTQPPHRSMFAGEIAFGAGVLLLWICFFSAGLSFPTAELRKELGKTDLALGTKIQYAFYVTCCYTVTNLLFLSCLAALMGCMMCRWRVRDKVLPAEGASAEEAVRYPGGRLYFSALLRGFFIYLVAIAGLLLVSTEAAVENTGFVQYIRLAGFISVISFAAGYEPTLSNRLMGRVTDLASAEKK